VPDRDDLSAELKRIAERCTALPGGAVADYIRPLADADSAKFAIALSLLDGEEHAAGDADHRFPIQSISKVIALTLAMQRLHDDLWERVGREPSGDPFNSLVQLEHERGIPRNPLINAGAIVVDDVLLEQLDDPKAAAYELLCELAGTEISVDAEVAIAEEGSGDRNRAMAHLMKSFGNLHGDVADVMEVYNHQCALALSTLELARAFRFLANDGVDPASGRRVLSDADARRVNAVMLTCGTYDAAGQFAFSVGVPLKSGVAGGIAGDVPHQMGLCVWSPALDESGNSLAGRVALEQLTERLDLSIF
jgi:glutaminase